MSGVSFRQAALEGNVATMRSLLANVEIEEAGAKTQMTAAHWAAVKGHASVLRFLHSLGDSFSKANVKRRLPEQMAKDPECKRVFELVRLARKTLAVVDKVFPDRIDVNQPGGLSEKFNKFRADSVDLLLNDLGPSTVSLVASVFKEAQITSTDQLSSLKEISLNWEKLHCEPFTLKYEAVTTLKLAKQFDVKGAPCGETSSIAFGYLAYVLKTNYLVERAIVSGETGNHAFVILNRDPNSKQNFGLDNALIIDAYTRQSFFCGNVGDAKTTIDVGALNQKSILCSTVRAPVPEAPWPQTNTISIMEGIDAMIATKNAEAFNEWGITAERGQ